jgi:hypothetical protein
MEENKTAQDSIDALKSSGADSSVLTVGVLQGYQGTGGSGRSERHVVVLAE